MGCWGGPTRQPAHPLASASIISEGERTVRNLVNRLRNKGGQPDEARVAQLRQMLDEAGPETLRGCRRVVAIAIVHSQPHKTEHSPRKWATEFLKQYKRPGWVPESLEATRDTPVTMTQMRDLPRREGSAIRRSLAELLAEIAPDADLEKCSAIAFSGENPALGYTQFSVLAA